MILVFKKNYQKEAQNILRQYHVPYQIYKSGDRFIFILEKNPKNNSCLLEIKRIPGFMKKIELDISYPLASRESKPENTVVKVNEVEFGNGQWQVIAGPCSIENYEQAENVISFLLRNGIKVIRGGLFKPRTSPYSFQGLRERGVEIIRELKKKYKFYFVSEVIIPSQMELLDEVVDVWQIGTRSMANYDLLRAVGKTNKPVLLKRGIMATIEEWLLAAEYILKEGNENIVLCERGIRTFEPLTRFTFDINAIPVVKELSHLPIIADPSHAVGKRNWVLPLAKAALIAGADGIIVEVHPKPDYALSDADQSLDYLQFQKLIEDIHKLKEMNINFEYE